MTFVAAFSVKQGRNWGIFIGILGVLAGIVILAYPIDSALTLAFIGGIWLVILGIMRSSAPSTVAARSNGRRSRSTRPASIFEKSRMSLMIVSSASPEVRIVST